jgi:hypothetical protein
MEVNTSHSYHNINSWMGLRILACGKSGLLLLEENEIWDIVEKNPTIPTDTTAFGGLH